MGIFGWYIAVSFLVVGVLTAIALYSARENIRKRGTPLLRELEYRSEEVTKAVAWLGLKSALIWPYIIYTHLYTEMLTKLEEILPKDS